jgi:opine dehydrogenase
MHTEGTGSGRALVCGAGNGGHAIAAHLALIGLDVTLYTRTKAKYHRLRELGNRIRLSGIDNRTATLANVTMDIAEAMEGQDKVLLVTTATAHDFYADLIAPYATSQDFILMCPGVGGALSFASRIHRLNPTADITVAETDTLIYACRMREPGECFVKGKKNEIIYTTWPENRHDIDSFIHATYPEFQPNPNPLMGLDDSPVLHIVTMTQNAKRIANGESFNFYLEGITPAIADYMERMDAERCQVATAMGLQPRTISKWIESAYGVSPGSLYEMIQRTPAYMNGPGQPNQWPAPDTFHHRYLLEEVPVRAVPTVEIATALGIETPLYREAVDNASRLTGIDFWRTGRTINDMGLTAEDVRSWRDLYLSRR